jgi:hypothetical protein
MVPLAAAPWLFLVLFIAASFLMIWRLESMTENGMEGTVLGTLIMPYCSGMGIISLWWSGEWHCRQPKW